MLEGGAHAAKRIYFKPCLSWWYERLLRGFNEQIRGFFFRKVLHAGQPHCVRLIQLQNHWHGQTTERTQRCRDVVICLRSPKYLLAEFRPDLGGTKDTSAQGAWRAQSVWMGSWCHWLSPRASCAHRARRGFPGLWVGCTAQGHRVGLNWACGCFLFGLHSVYFNLLPKKIYNVERTVS